MHVVRRKCTNNDEHVRIPRLFAQKGSPPPPTSDTCGHVTSCIPLPICETSRLSTEMDYQSLQERSWTISASLY